MYVYALDRHMRYVGSAHELTYYIDEDTDEVFSYNLNTGAWILRGSLDELLRLPHHLRPT